MMVTEHTDAAERDAHQRLERALLRSSALQAGIIAGIIRRRARRIAAARVALAQAAHELATLRARNTRWLLAMHRARRRRLGDPYESSLPLVSAK